MSITCPRCSEQIEGVPDGCRDPACPRQEIERLEREQYDSIMASVKAESDSNVAYGEAKNAVIAAARELETARCATGDNWSHGNFWKALVELSRTLTVLDALEKQP